MLGRRGVTPSVSKNSFLCLDFYNIFRSISFEKAFFPAKLKKSVSYEFIYDFFRCK